MGMADRSAVKYVALLAFKKIVLSHPDLVSLHQDVIMDCIDDHDVSIRLQALDLSAGMVNKTNLVDLVDRLLRQLRHTPSANNIADDDRSNVLNIEPVADPDGEDPELVLRPSKQDDEGGSALPLEYRMATIEQILDMCAKDTYASISDFEWYIDVLVQLVDLVPLESGSRPETKASSDPGHPNSETTGEEVSTHIGQELCNVAVRVSSVRSEAVHAAASLLLALEKQQSITLICSRGGGVLRFAVWIAGEYAERLTLLDATLNSLIHPKVGTLRSATICAYLQAIPKVLIAIISRESGNWNRESQTMMSLLMARLLHFLEPLTVNPSLEVQERAVELAELIRVASQAVTDHESKNDHWPLLLTKAIPQLFRGSDINPVAPSAQGRIPLPDDIHLDFPINPNLARVLQCATEDGSPSSETVEFQSFYKHRPARSSQEAQPAAARLALANLESSSYQNTEETYADHGQLARKRFERRSKNKDDPFYIGGDETSSGASTPFHDIIKDTNGEGVDVDSIPIMNLDLGVKVIKNSDSEANHATSRSRHTKKYQIAMDENIDLDETSDYQPEAAPGRKSQIREATKKSLLQVDSSGLGSLSLEGQSSGGAPLSINGHSSDDTEMAKALQEVERLRLEMQRASERVLVSKGVSAEGTLVKKKKKRVKKVLEANSRYAQASTEEASLDRGKDDEHAARNVDGDAPIIKRKKRRKPDVAS